MSEAFEMINEDMTKLSHSFYKAIMAQQEEILRAFIAQHGCKPDEVVQIIQGTKYFLRRRTPEEVALMKVVDKNAKEGVDLHKRLNNLEKQLEIEVRQRDKLLRQLNIAQRALRFYEEQGVYAKEARAEIKRIQEEA